ncbi:response regulator transcription factor [Desulfococcaceae bacterium HSG9]|nr:response regulator transcription factor [Desulfococcaceae bacterium HSG9]
MRILIAEDDLTSRNILAAVLKKNGHEVLETVDGAEAWDEMQKPDAPKLAILDWLMPEIDGLEVARRIRALSPPHPPYIIMLTQRDKTNDIITALDAGADDYLAKPFDPGELRARIGVGQRMVKIQELLAAQVVELKRATEQVKTLHGILPICSLCKKIRNDQGYWDKVEVYMRDHSEAEFIQSFCPECLEKNYPELYKGAKKLIPKQARLAKCNLAQY